MCYISVWTLLLRLDCTLLRCESSTLILYKELSSPIFQSCQWVSGIFNTCSYLHFVQYIKAFINALYWPSIINYHLLPPHSVLYWPSTQLHHLVTHSWANAQLNLIFLVLPFSLIWKGRVKISLRRFCPNIDDSKLSLWVLWKARLRQVNCRCLRSHRARYGTAPSISTAPGITSPCLCNLGTGAWSSVGLRRALVRR